MKEEVYGKAEVKVEVEGKVRRASEKKVLTGSKSRPIKLLTKYLYFKGEVLLHILNHHDQEWQFDAQGSSWFDGTCYVGGSNVCSGQLQN